MFFYFPREKTLKIYAAHKLSRCFVSNKLSTYVILIMSHNLRCRHKLQPQAVDTTFSARILTAVIQSLRRHIWPLLQFALAETRRDFECLCCRPQSFRVQRMKCGEKSDLCGIAGWNAEGKSDLCRASPFITICSLCGLTSVGNVLGAPKRSLNQSVTQTFYDQPGAFNGLVLFWFVFLPLPVSP